ncbi:UNVERIFIED_CONTAM: hypothetical protein NCL1_35841 [Trichonephila clavipes]
MSVDLFGEIHIFQNKKVSKYDKDFALHNQTSFPLSNAFLNPHYWKLISHNFVSKGGYVIHNKNSLRLYNTSFRFTINKIFTVNFFRSADLNYWKLLGLVNLIACDVPPLGSTSLEVSA